jgi:hypothetical protein
MAPLTNQDDNVHDVCHFPFATNLANKSTAEQDISKTPSIPLARILPGYLLQTHYRQKSGSALNTGENMEQLIIAFSLALLISVGGAIIVIQGQKKKRVKPRGRK